jgi:thiol-disulfide isomerase/thioredoxin
MTVSVAAFAVTCVPVSRPSRLFKSSSGTVLAAKYKTFDEMLENHSDVPLLIDFYSPFCGPCKVTVCSQSALLLLFTSVTFELVWLICNSSS